ncbi:MAG: methyltransferase domain-containing protein [Chitinophagales bacterium]|nr:methyltransferase domain-containing protein [Chitinophagales bacterium]
MIKTPPWYETWFDSPYYPILYKHRNPEEARFFIDNLIHYLEVAPSSRILDLACGRGRHANYLAEKGFHVTGIDISTQSIEDALRDYPNEHLEFYVQDMRLPFRINYFDFVFNFFTSFGYLNNLRDNQSVIAAIRKGLKSGGKAMIDFMNVEKVINNLVDRETKEIDGIQFYIRKQITDGFIQKDIKVDDGKKISLFKEEVQILKPFHFYQMIQEEGFKLVKEFGNYNLDPFDAKTSDRYIIIIEKL